MKKLFFIAAVLVGVSSLGFAEYVDIIPTGPDNALQSAAYGGVSVTTLSVVRNSSAPLFIQGPATVYGALWSSATPQGNIPLFTKFSTIDFSSLSAVATSTSAASEAFRLYYSSVNPNNGLLKYGDAQWLPYPIYSETGWIVETSTTAFNSVCVPFNNKKGR